MADVFNNTTNAKFIPTIIAQKALGRFSNYMNLAKTVARDFDYAPATFGQTIKVPVRGNLVANDKVQGSVFTLQNPTATDVSVTLNKHKEVSFMIDDVTKVLQNQDTMAGYAEDGAIALAEAVEAELAGLYGSIGTTVQFDVSSNATIDASMLALRKYFTDAKVPKLEQKYGYFDSTVINKLLGVERYAQANMLGKGGVIESGALFNIYGMNVFESQSVVSEGSPVNYHNMVYTRDAFVLATRPLPAVPAGMGAVSTVVNDPNTNVGLRVTSSWDADLGALKVTLDLLFGVALLDARRVVELESH